MAAGDDLLVVEDLVKHFPVTRGIVFQKQVASVKAVDGISFTVKQGETLGVVGESGCGKSTMARCLMRLLDPTSGRITFAGRDITHLSRTEMRPIRRELMMIFQDPYASLNQRKRVGFIVAEALQVHKIGTPAEIKRRVQELLEVVGLNPEHYNRFPHEFSGGQRQRIGVARALAVNPKLIVCDEPVSALDVSVQAQILNLLKDLQRDFGLTYVFIAHDLNVVRHISDRVLVMYLGKVAEIADRNQLYAAPEASVHGRAALGRADPEPGARPPAPPDRARGRRPEPDQPARGVPLPPALPALPRRATATSTSRSSASFGDGQRAACHYPLERWPMTGDEIRRADEEAVAAGYDRDDRSPPRAASSSCWPRSSAGRPLLSLLLGLLLGASPSRSVAVGLYLVGCALLLGGFFVGNRGPSGSRTRRGWSGSACRAACASPPATSRRSRST